MKPTNDHWKEAVRASWAKLRAVDARVGACPRVEWSKRMTRCAGMAYIEEGFIRLSAPIWFKYPEGVILEIIPHELAHVAAWRAFNEPGHGNAWKECMRALGLEPHRLWSEARMRQHRARWVREQDSKFILEDGE